MYLNKDSRTKNLTAQGRDRARPEDQFNAQVTALRIDFVAKPGDAIDVASNIGELLEQAGLHREGLQASMLLVSDREARSTHSR